MSSRRLRAQLQAAAYALLSRMISAPGSVTVSVADELASVSITVAPIVVPAPLSDMERAIVQALGNRTLTAKALAPAAGYRYSSYFRKVLADMTRRGLILRTADGYRLPGRG